MDTVHSPLGRISAHDLLFSHSFVETVISWPDVYGATEKNITIQIISVVIFF